MYRAPLRSHALLPLGLVLAGCGALYRTPLQPSSDRPAAVLAQIDRFDEARLLGDPALRDAVRRAIGLPKPHADR